MKCATVVSIVLTHDDVLASTHCDKPVVAVWQRDGYSLPVCAVHDRRDARLVARRVRGTEGWTRRVYA